MANNGEYLVYLAEDGIRAMSPRGNHYISRKIDSELRPLMATQYNDTLYVSCVWSPFMRQFLFMISAARMSASEWGDAAGGTTLKWEDSATSAEAYWDDDILGEVEDSQRVKFWAWSPEAIDDENGGWAEYTFPYATDENLTRNYPTQLFHPSPASTTLDLQQDKTFMLYYDGTATEGKIALLFDKDAILDDGDWIDTEVITGRCQPGEQADGMYRRFSSLGFNSSYSDPTTRGSSLQYLLDYEDPHLRNYQFHLKSFYHSHSDEKPFTDQLGKFFHLYVRDRSSDAGSIILADFYVRYYEQKRKESR
jgi:hypothetical protein